MGGRRRLTINIIANAALGHSLSGGDRIFIESARRWTRWGHTVNVYVWEEGREMCQRNKLEGVNFVLWPLGNFKRFGFSIGYLFRTIKGCLEVLKMTSLGEREKVVIYSASDFWPDSLPAFLMSERFKAPWVAGFFLFAPNPFRGFTGDFQFPSLRSAFYFFGQKPIYRLIKRAADLIFVTYDLDRIPFERDGVSPERIKAVYGGVDLREVEESSANKGGHYTGCFVGRFHPQKGLEELVEIWALVCRSRRKARLALIGTGEKKWEKWLRQEVKRKNLEGNVDFLGFLDGREKFKVLKSAKVYLCTSLYDSGGMATIEAMAAGLPVVSFDIPAIRSLIPRGTLRVPFRDSQSFAKAVLRILADENLSARISCDASSLAKEWDWNKRARRSLRFFEELLKKEDE